MKNLKIIFVMLGLVLSAGQVNAAALEKPALKIVASFSIVADLVRQIGGDQVAVTALVAPDSDAHAYQPSPHDARIVAGADLVIVNGLGFEGWIERLIRNAQYQGKIVTLTKDLANPLSVEPEDEHGHDHHHKHDAAESDPHAWQDLANGRLYVRNIADALVAADPGNAATYTANAARLDAELAALDQWVRQQIETVPSAKRRVVTGHDAFGYFARAYGVTFMAPLGLNTEDEPSARELKTLMGWIRENGIGTLFVENMSNPAIVRQLATETGAMIGPRLYADALSGTDGPAASYQAMFRHNVTALVAGMRSGR